MDTLSVAARFDKIVRAQSRELLRHGRLAHIQNLLKLVDGLFPVDQQTKNEKTSSCEIAFRKSLAFRAWSSMTSGSIGGFVGKRFFRLPVDSVGIGASDSLLSQSH